MTYLVKTNHSQDEFDLLSQAVPHYVSVVTGRQAVTLYGPETLASDGIMSRDVIASYSPPDKAPISRLRATPPGGSVRAYHYALGHVDSMDGLAWFDESDAAKFSLEQHRASPSEFKGEWKAYVRRNEPREE